MFKLISQLIYINVGLQHTRFEIFRRKKEVMRSGISWPPHFLYTVLPLHYKLIEFLNSANKLQSCEGLIAIAATWTYGEIW